MTDAERIADAHLDHHPACGQVPTCACAAFKILDLTRQNAALREALEHCRQRPHEHNPLPDRQGPTRCEVIDRALSGPAPDYVPRAEVGRAVEWTVEMEREACAKIAEVEEEEYRINTEQRWEMAWRDCASKIARVIRDRSEP